MKPTAFDIFHPLVPALYFLAVLVFTMAAFQPVFMVISLLGAVTYSIYLRGPAAVAKSLAWQLPFIALIALINPLFFSQGSTELFRIGTHAIYAESVFYGMFMGVMLVAVIEWLSCANHVISSDKIMMLTGNTAPTIGLMLSMISRLVPEFVARGRDIAGAFAMNVAPARTPASASASPSEHLSDADEEQQSHTQQKAAKKAKKEGVLKSRLRQMTVLMAWSMEDSLETAEAMRARGWGAVPKRTTYNRSSFMFLDGVVCAIFAALITVCAVVAVAATSQYTFFPKMSTLVLWWGYIPYALLVFLPLIMELVEVIRWKLH